MPVTRVVLLGPGTQTRVELHMSQVESDVAPAVDLADGEVAAGQTPLQGEHLRTFLKTASVAAGPVAIHPPATGASQPGDERRQARGARASRVSRVAVVAGLMQLGEVSVQQPFSYGVSPEPVVKSISLPLPPVTPEEPWLPAGFGSSPGFDPWGRWAPHWLFPLPLEVIAPRPPPQQQPSAGVRPQ